MLGRLELYEARGRAELPAADDRALRRSATISPRSSGSSAALAAEGLFAAERKRPLPRFPRAVGVVTGVDAAARGDVVAAITTRFPRCALVVAETRVQGRGATTAIVGALNASSAAGRHRRRHPRARRRQLRGSAALQRRGASCAPSPPARVPVVSAVGHEQDTPLCDLAADVRASTPTAAARLVVPDLDELQAALARAGAAARRAASPGSSSATAGASSEAASGCGPRRCSTSSDGASRSTAPPRASRPSRPARPSRAATRSSAPQTRSSATRPRSRPATALEIELARGGLGARVEEVRG